MAATMATMAVLNTKCLNLNSPKNKPTITSKPTSLLSMQNLPKGLKLEVSSSTSSLAGTAIAGAIFSTLSACDPAFAAQQIAELAEGADNRGTALLLPLIPAIAWVLYNILQPALNQINKMRETKGVIIGLGGLGAAGLMAMAPPQASAGEIAAIADAASDNRGQLVLFAVIPAILWVLYNILQPALNQINKMRSQ
ncbi:hypothetical protein Ddye_031439 [Dipteronia dyeriana]|uniref:Uncharacterized protein n=1 Tax=Dipteronia dyeriana TaxID=168575 RepID=A0AAD9WNF8_9ROSI|nr:hypothetical protein Ddye_031439 [Dipteronia dyeriana]